MSAPEPRLSLAQLLQRLSKREVVLSERDGSLVLGGAADTLNGAEREEIRCRTDEIVAYLRASEAAVRSFSPLPGAPLVPALIQEMWWGWCRPAEPQLPHEKLCVMVAVEADTALIKRCIQHLFERHLTLRSRFYEEGGKLRTAPQPAALFEAEIKPLADPRPLSEALPAERLNQLREQVLRIHDDRLSRAQILTRAGKPVAVALMFHHMVIDARSLALLEAEFLALVAAHGDPAVLEPVAQFTAFGAWEKAWLSEKGAPLIAYWHSWLAAVPVVHGPDGRALSWAPGLKANYDIEIAGHNVEAVRRLAERAGCSGFTVLLGATALAAARWSGEAEAPIRVISHLRSEKALAGMVGNLVCTDLIRIRTSEGLDPVAFLQLAAAEYAAARRLRLPNLLGLPDSPGFPDLSPDGVCAKMPITLNYMPMHTLRGPSPRLEAPPDKPVVRTAHEEVWPVPQSPINMRMWDYGDRLLGKFEFNQDLISPEDQHAYCDLFVEAVLELTSPEALGE
jgi:hypothetical protein